MSSQSSKTREHEPGRIGKDAQMVIRGRYDALQALPAPDDGPFATVDLPDHLSCMLGSLMTVNAIRVVERIRTRDLKRNTYRTDRSFWEALQAYEPNQASLPCSHHGLRNIRDGEYTCMAEWCDETFDRAAVEEVLGDV